MRSSKLLSLSRHPAIQYSRSSEDIAWVHVGSSSSISGVGEREPSLRAERTSSIVKESSEIISVGNKSCVCRTVAYSDMKAEVWSSASRPCSSASRPCKRLEERFSGRRGRGGILIVRGDVEGRETALSEVGVFALVSEGGSELFVGEMFVLFVEVTVFVEVFVGLTVFLEVSFVGFTVFLEVLFVGFTVFLEELLEGVTVFDCVVLLFVGITVFDCVVLLFDVVTLFCFCSRRGIVLDIMVEERSAFRKEEGIS